MGSSELSMPLQKPTRRLRLSGSLKIPPHLHSPCIRRGLLPFPGSIFFVAKKGEGSRGLEGNQNSWITMHMSVTIAGLCADGWFHVGDHCRLTTGAHVGEMPHRHAVRIYHQKWSEADRRCGRFHVGQT